MISLVTAPLFEYFWATTLIMTTTFIEKRHIKSESGKMSTQHLAHVKPPTFLREIFKECQKKSHDVSHETRTTLRKLDSTAFSRFAGSDIMVNDEREVIETSIPGLLIYPSLLPPEIQLLILDKLFHRDLSNPVHQTNVHLHHDISYPDGSFFASDLIHQPKDTHKPITARQFLEKKLRWMTLGGQYDWTRKVYSSDRPPFPEDLKRLIEDLFPMKAEAAIVNLYSPGDTLSLHRDVSEECDQPLVSISIGCDCDFVVGLGEDSVVLRLKSGDAVLMSGESRYAWHGVPKVLAGTCPEWLRDWPGDDFEEWKGWMAGKRINLNVRQMFE